LLPVRVVCGVCVCLCVRACVCVHECVCMCTNYSILAIFARMERRGEAVKNEFLPVGWPQLYVCEHVYGRTRDLSEYSW